MVKVVAIVVIFTFLSCVSGYTDKYGVYVPNTPSYKLKNNYKEVPKHLDTLNIYMLYGQYVNNKIVKKLYDEPNWNIYLKFSPNGRAYSFGTNNLSEKSLNPIYGGKGYYVYDGKKDRIKYEVFTNGNGGQYVIIDYTLSKNGDTLTSFYKKQKNMLYIKQKLPTSWKKYSINW